MRTPAGQECRYFYGDYFRGRQREECRLLSAASPPQAWFPDLCFTCPVPEVLLANACPHLELRPTVMRPFPFLKRRVRIQAHCSKTDRPVPEPKIGCGECHSFPPIITQESP